ncbi:MAG: PQQ-binding-like beta-propeller repeat protein [Verrucomicrobiales bacterium]|nr:PQQ-binding-like beta-propeller repeat protein [Verrucomicrobiales bacterium]
MNTILSCASRLSISFLIAIPFLLRAENNPAELANVHGGAVVQIGAPDASVAGELAKTGRYIINVLGKDSAVISKIRTDLHQQNAYGVASAELWEDFTRLPYTENLINLVIVNESLSPPEEIFRIMTPNAEAVFTVPESVSNEELESIGFFNIRTLENSWVIAQKPWPESMGHWTHSRHDSNGNAVSPDTEVGEPKRIRWIAAHSGKEVEGMVSDDGRNFYGQALSRDSFNGLRLWHRDLSQPEEKMDSSKFVMKPLNRDQARPVATENFLFAVAFPTRNLVAIDSVTGEIVRSFPDIEDPAELVQHKGLVVATGPKGVYAFDARTGVLAWKNESSNPRAIVAGEDRVSYIQGEPRRGEKAEAVTVDLYSGKVQWKNSSYPWLAKVKRSVIFDNQISYEVSSFSDFDDETGIHLLDAKTGELTWEKLYSPGMNHARQARALFIGDDLWIQQGGKVDYPDRETPTKFQPIQVTSLNSKTGETKQSLPGGLGHCAPPVATVNMMFSGVVEITDLNSGKMMVNSITKSNCSKESGFIPANGLIYSSPKHCTCWPMLRGYVAMASDHPLQKEGDYPPARPADEISFQLTRGTAAVSADAAQPTASDWPTYRHDEWRSGSATTPGPVNPAVLWETNLAPQGHSLSESSALRFDWKENPFIKGPISPPTIANGLSYIARPDAHEVIALDSVTGKIAWRYTARGRVDTPPTIYKGLCLFGDHSGYVHALRADSGEPVWELQAAPISERMGAYGQIESAWPVAGAVLVTDDIAYFAAGRQQLSDGGVFIFAADPMTGERHWVHKLNDIPQKGYEGDTGDSFGFYKNSGLEFDPIDILHKEGDQIAMSRWLISKDGKEVEVDTWNAFARLNTGNGAVYAPRGTWTYGFRQIHRFGNEAFRRSLCVYRDNMIVGALDSTTALYRRDFDLENGEEFNSKWITGWEAASKGRKGERPYRSDRIAEKASWKVNPWESGDSAEDLLKPTTMDGKSQLENKLFGMVMDSENRLYVIHQDGTLKIINTENGDQLSEHKVAPPIWDGLALANGNLYLSAADGRLVCLAHKEAE